MIESTLQEYTKRQEWVTPGSRLDGDHLNCPASIEHRHLGLRIEATAEG
jgi:hypothetical protein